MPVELEIVETTVELGQTNVEVILTSASEPGPAGPGVATGGTAGQVLTKDSGTDFDTSWQDSSGGGVTDADYLVGTAHGSLSAEIVVGTSPGGELGGTWASPTVDATHSGSTHAAVQAAAEATAATALSAHLTDTADAHDASAISIADAGNDFTATEVEGALAELQADHEADATALSDHIADATAAHAATAIAFTPDGSIAATTVQAAIVEVRDEAGGGGAPTDVDYLVGTASGGLSAEIAVGTTPGGELGGTWASPTVDATHSGSTHAAVQAAAEATAAAALSAHLTDTADAHDASAISVDSTTLVGTGTDAQAVFEELDNGIADHLADATAAHAGSAISVSSATLSGTGTDVQAVFEEIDNLLDDHSARHEDGGADEITIQGLAGTPVELTNHLNDSADAHDASAISVLDTGTFYTATDVEGVLAEIAPQLGGGSATGQLFLSAAGMWPSTTNGAAPNTKVEYGTNDVDMFHLDFADGATKLFAQATIAMPSDWDAGTVTATFYWTANSTSTNAVLWGCAGRSYGNFETIDQAMGTEVTVSDALNATANQVAISAATAAITLAGTPAAGQLVQFKVSRDPASGSDTLAATARLIGVMIGYGRT